MAATRMAVAVKAVATVQAGMEATVDMEKPLIPRWPSKPQMQLGFQAAPGLVAPSLAAISVPKLACC